ncbi:hypothetical protein TorRG33x02_237310 [Trema orientale]|uniref:Uncharacterized protein n=1 Tax=Trema orientale TaxID=63057 RepID=A0A2P5DZJ0_TREOI|nr:hypothetical protein TorRG33x02_237310 [Trema orientale]
MGFCLCSRESQRSKRHPSGGRVTLSTFDVEGVRHVFSVQVNKDVVAGKCFSTFKQYPSAHVYEYSKCKSPENGVSSILDAALAPPEISGVYFFGGKGRTIESSKLSYNARLGQELWSTSSDLLLQLQLATKETFTSLSDFMP